MGARSRPGKNPPMQPEPASGRRPRVAIVGGGFGGLAAAHELRRAEADVTLVCLLPEILLFYAHLPIYFSSMALLITVCTILDLAGQFRAERRLT